MFESDSETVTADSSDTGTFDGPTRQPTGPAGPHPAPGRTPAPALAARGHGLVEPSTVHESLDSTDDLVSRHRALAARDETDTALHCNLIAADLDWHAAELRRLGRQHRH